MRNWDYRYCWLRDATFTLLALMKAGYTRRRRAWREWLLRAAAGGPSRLQIMYGIAGERRLPEIELPWLPGYEDSRPVRIGNAAHRQFQLDVFGEVLDATAPCVEARHRRPTKTPGGWSRALVTYLEAGLARAGRRNLGSARTAPALHAFEDDGLGGASIAR